MNKGRVFSIEEFSIYDGDGIRTTVFLKGCPLKCSWCHSPEGQSFKKEFLRSPNGCANCGECLRVGKGKLTIDSVNACPKNLIRECGVDYTVDELVKILLKNADVLNNSGGGITFSGGEPLMQWQFLLECLKSLKGKVNRAIQTTGYCPANAFNQVIKEIDLALYDIKLIDDEAHVKYTGVSNKLILENYKTLINSGIKTITRIPLIPTVTDTESNIEGICKFLTSLSIEKVELLPYNQMAGAKYKLAGREYKPQFNPATPVNFREEIFNDYKIKFEVL